MKLGDKVRVRCNWTEIVENNNHNRHGGNMRKHETAEGTVVYIHPKGRYYTLEFRFQSGTFRESFLC